MGAAFRCRLKDVNDHSIRAIKVLYAVGDQSAGARFAREREILQGVDHPNVLPCLDHGLHDDHFPFLVLAFAAGGSLDGLLRRRKRLTTAEVAWIGYQIASGLRAAKVVHRDVKAENVLIFPPAACPQPEDPPVVVGDLVGGAVIKVADFGLAKTGDATPGTSLTLSQEIFGTPLYMAPEQIRNSKRVDHRVDIYAFGILLYEMAVGQLPFDGDSPYTVMSKQLQEKHVYPAEVVLDPGLTRVIDRCLQKEPDDRYQDYRELLADLRPLLGLPNGWRYLDEATPTPKRSWWRKLW